MIQKNACKMVVMKSQDDSGMIRSGKRMAQITGFSLGEVRRKERKVEFALYTYV